MSESCPECGSSTFYPNGGPGAYWCENCELEYWQESSGWYWCGADGQPHALETEGSA